MTIYSHLGFIKAIEALPLDQGGAGRHRCCGCAYELGYNLDLQREELLSIETDFVNDYLPTVRRKEMLQQIKWHHKMEMRSMLFLHFYHLT
ncbi:hypothetical protein Sps_04886 [Shewanella psychrophila]|uniref:Uncharacterized protein n=1 Tax=Shewanella psychrophila TaxID=225848 RepID=A0A1S6HWM0_9GAMM|nr:hypothetical protein Sps_04886 [Shewanella psychrophila]